MAQNLQRKIEKNNGEMKKIDHVNTTCERDEVFRGAGKGQSKTLLGTNTKREKKGVYPGTRLKEKEWDKKEKEREYRNLEPQKRNEKELMTPSNIRGRKLHWRDQIET